jgi:hypothetical protein
MKCCGNDPNRMRISHGQLRLSEYTDTVLTEADVYSKVSGTFIDGDCCNFEVVDNSLVSNCGDNSAFLFNGVSDLEVNKACTIHFALFKNGSLVERAETPHTFVTPSKTSNISITSIINLDKGDTLEVFCKSSEVNTTLSLKTLNVTLWGEH